MLLGAYNQEFLTLVEQNGGQIERFLLNNCIFSEQKTNWLEKKQPQYYVICLN